MSGDVVSILDLAEIAERMKSLRGRLAEYQTEVVAGLEAEVGLKISRRAFQAWEEGQAKTTLEKYGLLCRFYEKRLGEEIPLDWLLYGRGSIAYERKESPELETIAEVRRDLLNRLDDLEAEVRNRNQSLKAVS